VYLIYEGNESVEWINLDQDRDQWRAVMNTAMKSPDSITGGEFLD